MNLIWWGIDINFKKCFDFLIQLKSVKTHISSAAVGMEFFLFNTFGIHPDDKYKISDIVLRSGIEYNKNVIAQNSYSGGIGIIADKYSFDYAILYQSDYFEPTHYLSISARN